MDHCDTCKHFTPATESGVYGRCAMGVVAVTNREDNSIIDVSGSFGCVKHEARPWGEVFCEGGIKLSRLPPSPASPKRKVWCIQNSLFYLHLNYAITFKLLQVFNSIYLIVFGYIML